LKPLPPLACLLLGVAGLLLVRGTSEKREVPATPTPSKSRERGPRVASVQDLLSSGRELGQADRESWVRSLSDSDLQRLTRALITDYLATFPASGERTNADFIHWLVDEESPEHKLRLSMVPLLALCAMESGRRDIEGFLVRINELCGKDSAANPGFVAALRGAASAGLAADDPGLAWKIQAGAELPVVATEAIFRRWATKDPGAALDALATVPFRDLGPATRGLLAETTDAGMRGRILEWIDAKTAVPAIAGVPSATGRVVENIITDGEHRGGEGKISRNSIDAILNNPNRFDPQQLKISVALGLAEQDPAAAWERIRPAAAREDEVPLLGDIPVIGRLFHSTAMDFLRQWAARQPGKARDFYMENSDLFNGSESFALAQGLLPSDPAASLELLSRVADTERRRDLFGDLTAAIQRDHRSESWPLLPNLPEVLPVEEALARLSRNLHLLDLPPADEARARNALDALLEPAAR
jgi:hypothetical protein